MQYISTRPDITKLLVGQHFIAIEPTRAIQIKQEQGEHRTRVLSHSLLGNFGLCCNVENETVK